VPMNFLEYLQSKKIDAAAFQHAEADMFKTWQTEFDQMHPNSFTIQKLNLINPIRRRFQLKEIPPTPPSPSATSSEPSMPSAPSKPVMRPMIKPKPKLS
jgi:hypothetical protein